MSSRSRVTGTASSQPGEPALDLGPAQLAAEPGPAQRVLELLLVLGTTPEQPAGARVDHRVAERGVQPPPDSLDEVVVVALHRAVVAAGERDPAPAVQWHPAGEVDRLDPGQAA